MPQILAPYTPYSEYALSSQSLDLLVPCVNREAIHIWELAVTGSVGLSQM